MGVETQRGPHGQPIYNSRAETTADFQRAVDYAGAVGNWVVVSSYAEMTTGFVAKFGFEPYDGLHCFNLDSGDTTVWNDAAQSWDDPNQLSIQTDGVFTASSGWSIAGGSQKLIRLGAHDADYYFSFKRTGPDLDVKANGNLDNVSVGRVVLPPLGGPQRLGGGYSGRLTSYMVDTTGLVQLTAAAPGNTIGTGDFISASGRLIV
jgi:hypothetical protein